MECSNLPRGTFVVWRGAGEPMTLVSNEAPMSAALGRSGNGFELAPPTSALDDRFSPRAIPTAESEGGGARCELGLTRSRDQRTLQPPRSRVGHTVSDS